MSKRRTDGTLVDVLRERCDGTPGATALEFADVGQEEVLSYAELDGRARTIAAALLERGLSGERALLLYPPGPAYVAAFFGCLYAGVIAVPLYPSAGSRGVTRILAVAGDAGAAVALSTAAVRDAAAATPADPIGSVTWLATDELPGNPGALGEEFARAGNAHTPRPEDLAFLQYTSGSTGTPKGVMVRHGNLMHNLAVISAALDAGPDTRGASWLPPYHDMGLIGGILAPVHGGFPCTLLSPMSFLRRPHLWLETISTQRATVTAAPDFGYRECVRRIGEEDRAALDLSCVEHAMVGAEPVRPATLEEFSGAFAVSGFRRAAFHPCYGLAESTLFVTGGTAGGAGARTVEVDRRALEEGTAVEVSATAAQPSAESGGGEPTVQLTGCGRPFAGDLVVVVDPADGSESAPGRIGEVCVSGPSVTGGYWERPDETSSAFRAELPGRPGRHFLRTGDLGFQLDGELYLTGRIRELMVVRGRNHHPDDVEQTAERDNSALRPGRSAAFSVDDGHEERVVLVHEVAPSMTEEDARAVTAAVRENVAAGHGIAVHEVVLVRPGGIPRTTSGKVRRGTAREWWLAGTLDRIAAAPGRALPEGDGNDAPAELTRAVAAVVDLPPEELPAHEPLIGLGLDSLRAVRLSSALFHTFGTDLPLDRLLDGITLAGVSQLVAAQAGTRPEAQPDAAAAPDGTGTSDAGAVPSRAQELVWLLDVMGAGGAYHVHGGVRLSGPVDGDLLAHCLDDLTERHPALRSVFTQDADGSLTTRVRPPEPLELRRVDLTDGNGQGGQAEREARFSAVTEELATAPFDLERGPLFRAALIHRGDDEWYLGVAAHHIVVDGWSLGVLLRQLGEQYRARLAGGPAADVSAAAQGPGPEPGWSEADAGYWKRTLASAAPVDLPLDAPVPQSPSWRGGALDVEFGSGLVSRLRRYGREHNATLFMVLLAGMSVVTSRWSGQDDLVIGTPTAARDHRNADAVGMFTNVVPLRVDASGERTFDELVAGVRSNCLDAYRHRAVPFDEIMRLAGVDRSGGRAPLVRVTLALQSVPLAPWQAGGVRAEAFELPAPGAQFELSVHLTETPDGGLRGHLGYAADLLEPETARRIADALGTVLHAVAEGPAAPVADLPVLGDTERVRIVDELSGRDTPPAAPGTLHGLFEEQADRDPTAPALIAGDRTLSYGELETRANRLAWLLRESGVRADEPVAVCVPRSPELLVGLLAVLKAGGAYLPLDPEHPHARIAAQLRAAEPRIVLATRETEAELPADEQPGSGADGRPHVVLLDSGEDADGDPSHAGPADPASGRSAARPDAVAGPRSLAYVIHTSGTTGTPKGVMNEHAGVVNRILWMQQEYGLTAGERVLHKTPLGFDVAGWELFWPLAVGGTVVLARPGGHREPAYLAGLIRELGVTTCHFVPSMLQAFLEDPGAAECAGTLNRVVCSGEELPPALAERLAALLPGTHLHNLYGPAEAAIDVTACEIGPSHLDRPRLPIGRPVTGARVYVLDRRGAPLPVGVPGELCVGGVQVARGYHGAPASTADRFVPDPWEPGGRLYRTGDLARWSQDGTLEFLGRFDRQVKIRGHRVEPGEVEAVLAAHEDVAAAVVDVRTAADGAPALAAYLVAADEAEAAPEGTREPTGEDGLRRFVAGRLPAAMIPATFDWLPALPTGPNGKLDRSALPRPAAVATAAVTPPRDKVEEQLAAIWTEVLGVSEVSVTCGFFELGGHSLLAARIVARIRRDFGVDVPAARLLGGDSSIEALALSVQETQWSQAGPEELSRMLADLEELSDSQVASLLEQDSESH